MARRIRQLSATNLPQGRSKFAENGSVESIRGFATDLRGKTHNWYFCNGPLIEISNLRDKLILHLNANGAKKTKGRFRRGDTS